MTLIQISTRIILTILSLLGIVWMIRRNADFLVSGFGVIEFREKDLMVICLLCLALMRAQWQRGPLIAAIAISFLVAGFTIISKGVILFFSEDKWIAAWHAGTFAAGCCLFVLTLLSLTRAQKMKPDLLSIYRDDGAPR